MTPQQSAVLSMLRAQPDGVCRREFADIRIYHPAARIHELRKLEEFWIETSPCKRHRHPGNVKQYQLVREAAA